MEFEYNGVIINYTIEYRNRKTVEFMIDATGVVRVRAPKGTDEKLVIDLVMSKKDWIIKKLDLIFNKNKSIKKREFETGSLIPFLGENISLKINIWKLEKISMKMLENELVINAHKDFTREEYINGIEKIYKAKLKSIINERVKKYSNNFKIKPNKIAIKSQQRIWGSCSSNRNINFNWKLMMAPMEIIDYIVVHEMCHLMHMNHSRSFWRLVGKIMPDYKKHQEWLKVYGYSLDLNIEIS